MRSTPTLFRASNKTSHELAVSAVCSSAPRNRRKVEPGKNYVEARQPRGIFPTVCRRLSVDLLSHHQIKPVEPFEAVVTRQYAIDLLHHRNDIGDRRRGRATHDLKKLRVDGIEVRHSMIAPGPELR